MTFGRELYSDDLAREFLPLLEDHYHEIAHFKDIPLDPAWDIYANIETNGGLRIYTAREGGRLMGYLIFFVRDNPHYKSSKQAVQDILFLVREMRKGFSGAKFIKWCDDQLVKEGVQVVYHHVKVANDFGPVLERMKYEKIETIWAKRLDQWEDK